MTPVNNSMGKSATRTGKAARSAKAVPKGPGIPEEVDERDLPGDASGRLKIKRQYEELLGIRVEKLKGRVLNREKINKTIEGIYYICIECKKICHNLDEGLIQDPESHVCYCENCRRKK